MTKNILNTVWGVLFFAAVWSEATPFCLLPSAPLGQTHVCPFSPPASVATGGHIYSQCLRGEFQIRKHSSRLANQVFAGKKTWELAAPCLTLAFKRSFRFIPLKDTLCGAKKRMKSYTIPKKKPSKRSKARIFSSEILWEWQNVSPSLGIPSWEWEGLKSSWPVTFTIRSEVASDPPFLQTGVVKGTHSPKTRKSLTNQPTTQDCFPSVIMTKMRMVTEKA